MATMTLRRPVSSERHVAGLNAAANLSRPAYRRLTTNTKKIRRRLRLRHG